jgi:hypothetical protein
MLFQERNVNIHDADATFSRHHFYSMFAAPLTLKEELAKKEALIKDLQQRPFDKKSEKKCAQQTAAQQGGRQRVVPEDSNRAVEDTDA